jgi:hypothetical protein
MSEMPLGSDELPADRLNEALVAFTGCIGESLDAVCSYGLTIGEAYVPFDPDPEDDCEDDEALCTQAWVRVMSVQPTGTVPSFGGDCGGVMQMTLEVGILRCFVIPEGGEAPTATDTLLAATQAMTDMNAIYCAAMACEVWDSIESGAWEPMGPLGGQYGGVWTFTVEI